MVEKVVDHFNLEQICDSGQCFRMKKKSGNLYEVIAGDRYLAIRQNGNRVSFDCTQEEYEEFWKRYFDLETDYKKFIHRIDCSDSYLIEAARFGSGIRILRQDLWEMIVSFLISQQNNIQRIRRCIENLCETYGEKKQNKAGYSYYAFPKPEALAGLGEDDLKECNLGYRSKYVVRTAKMAADTEVDLQKIEQSTYPKAKEELMKFYGVGSKVADCICLFALHQMEAFPVDTHISQALREHYPNGFPMEDYPGFQGILQQYIFYYELMGKKTKEQ